MFILQIQIRIKTGADVTYKFYSSTALSHWNKAIWLDVSSHMSTLF